MKKLILLFAAIMMASTGMWAETVDYLYPVYNTDGVPTSGIKEWKTASVDATVVEDAATPVTWGTAGETTWYVVTGTNVTLSKGAICAGDVRLILADGAKLTADYANKSNPVIEVSGAGNSLTIYGQAAQTGQLIASGGTNAGIGGGNGESGSNITINGGTITATSIFYGAGIGGGNGVSGSNITINGGTVTATGGDDAAGIGGGNQGDGSNITINGGIVTATGRGGAAGIGGGNEGNGSNITINGGIVTATGRDGAAGIGGGNGGYSSNIFVATTRMIRAGSSSNPATVIANTGADLASVLAGKQYVKVMPPVSYIDENGEEQAAYASEITSSADRVSLGAIGEESWYIVTGTDVQFLKGASCAGNVNLILADDSKLTATGDYNYAGIQVSGEGNSLTIYGQTAQSGQLEAKGGSWTAGIGGGKGADGSNITINGGTVTATGGYWAAGIGGSYYGNGTNIVINGGTVTATGGEGADGIGGGNNGGSSNIFVAPTFRKIGAGSSSNSATLITNTGADLASVLGGKQYVKVMPPVSYIDENGEEQAAYASEITSSADRASWGAIGEENWYIVTDADVTLSRGAICQGDVHLILADDSKLTATGDSTGPWNNAGIQVSGEGNSLTIYGQTAQSGQLEAIGADYSAGIGGGQGEWGYGGIGSNIIINGGNVTATGGCWAAGIGGGHGGYGGYGGSGSNITINGGNVTANGGDNAAGIGGGYGERGYGDPRRSSASDITVATTLMVKADGNNPPTTGITNNGGDLAESLAGKRYVTVAAYEWEEVTYIEENSIEKKASALVLKDTNTISVSLGNVGKDTWYVVTGADVQFLKGASCAGNVNLILADGAKLTSTGEDAPGIQVSGDGNSLTIYGQAAQSGQLIATSVARYAAGIGGGDEANGSNITINGGTVTAIGGHAASGIGGGHEGSGYNIAINGGTVTATGGFGSAGIGGGFEGSGFNITINGGMVTANGDGYGAGIGGGYDGYGSNITINGGTVTANGGDSASGIGSGMDGAASSNIFVANILSLTAGSTENPADAIANNGGDLTESLAGKRYVTVSDDVCNITANQDPNNKTNYYSTFYSGKKAYSVPEGVTAYTGVAEGDVLKLTPIADGIIPAGEAVILRLITEDDTDASLQIVLTATTTTATKSDDNMLQGSDEPMTLPTNSYALSLGQHGVGFYDFSGSVLPAHKAYLTLAAASAGLRFSFGDATDIDVPVTATPANAYNLQGQRVDENYRGIVIINGKKSYNN